MKKSFKDFVTQDVGKVFFNGDEFADLHVWQGKEVLMIVEDDENNKSSNLEKEHSLVTKDVYFADKTVRVQAGLISKPRNGARITLDDRLYNVVHSDVDTGMLTIKLQANEV
ncbi:MAG: hypothetical protein ABS917_05430 [Solibacillus sp.]|uniref:hypothetical protein n=1 Tax=Solibacillus sp. TaxID=1909654 RepID=UPI0033149602